MAEMAASILRHAFGDALDDASLEALSEAAVQEVYAAGDVFVRQGEIGNALYVIVEGLVEVSQKLDDGQEIILAILEPGQYVGELALLDQEPRMATCRAVTPLTLLSFSQQIFTSLTHDNPSVARLLLGHVIKNMRGQDQLVIRELRSTNEALRRAYTDLQRAQAELVEKERLEHELALAAEAQRSLLPGTLPDLPPLHFSAYLRPARQVGGDFYDVIVLDDEHVGLLLADVADKGMYAALIMAVARTLFRT
ncbi:MAG: cyclic nucleotide-binding domain-containing protein, partial [Chloroflexota bacterium]